MTTPPPAEPQTLKEMGLAIYRAADAFLQTLWPMQKDMGQNFPPYALYPFASENRFEWYFLPASLVMHAGLPLRAMNPQQQQAALELLRASTSEPGYRYAETVRQLELVLRDLEQGTARPFRRDPEAFHFTIFGLPSEHGTWGWRYEGHHCSLQWTMVDGEVIASTPQFLGTSPDVVRKEVPDGPGVGTRILALQEDLARALVQSLTPDQQREALLTGPVPGEILTTNQRRATIQENRGVLGRSLNTDQRGLLRKLIESYGSVQHRPVTAERMRRIEAAQVMVDGAILSGWEGIRFAWTGPTEPGPLHYYRLFQDRSFLIEYDTPMNEPFHRHTVWRDFNNDYGLDVLARLGRPKRFDELGLAPEWGPDPLAHHYAVGDHQLLEHDHDHGLGAHDHSDGQDHGHDHAPDNCHRAEDGGP